MSTPIQEQAILWIGFGFPATDNRRRRPKNPNGIHLGDLCWHLNNCWQSPLFIPDPRTDQIKTYTRGRWALQDNYLGQLYEPVLKVASGCKLIQIVEVPECPGDSLLLLKP